ncbi:MAG: tRNA pseudouridine(55) synthase TruB [Proteobacteria bacterium]|nr:tRNA pseudouridine(55) synthase TruB [Pseudomonadota bacterium]
MARKPRGEPIHGWLNVDKPRGLTSTQVVARIKRLTGAAKVGHGGTLDPMASGVLPIALGEATKTVAYVMEGAKSYRFVVRWGEARSTDDAEGEVIETSPVRPSAAAVEAVLGEFVGEIAQVPPRFSAVKVGGERAYRLARAEKEVVLEPRRVRIEALRLVRLIDADHAEFEVRCGKGAYMRSLARDLARRLGTVGHVAELRRSAVGPFREEDAIPLEKLEALGHSPAVLGQMLPIETALDGIPALALSGTEAARLRSGQAVSILGAARRMPKGAPGIARLTEGTVVCAVADGKPVALARIESGMVHPVRVLNL